jgi:hypothetical protein
MEEGSVTSPVSFRHQPRLFSSPARLLLLFFASATAYTASRQNTFNS